MTQLTPINSEHTEVLFDTTQVAELLGVRPYTVRKWRMDGRGPKFFKVGPSPKAPVRYRREDVQEWMMERLFGSTSEASEAVRLGDA